MKQQNRLYLIIYVAALLMLSGQLITGCSSTSALKEDEQLFTGLAPIEYKNYEKELMLILPSPRWRCPGFGSERCLVREQLLPHAVPCAPVDMECFLSVGWSVTQVDNQGVRFQA